MVGHEMKGAWAQKFLLEKRPPLIRWGASHCEPYVAETRPLYLDLYTLLH